MSERPEAVSVGGDNGEHMGEENHGVGGSAVHEGDDGGARGEVARLGFTEGVEDIEGDLIPSLGRRMIDACSSAVQTGVLPPR